MSRYIYDSTTGVETLISGNNDNFVGTRAEWNTLTTSEKAKYKTIDITDDFNQYIVDNTPTQNSNNVVKSGGVYTNVDNVYKAMGVTGGKNLFYAKFDAVKALNINGSWSDNTFTHRGISFICDIDNNGYVTKVTVNGTSSSEGDSFFNFYQNNNRFPISKGDYILNGCPVGGNFSNGYALYAYTGDYKVDTGDGVSFSIASDTVISVNIVVRNNYTISNKVFYPMIRLASDTDNTYQPYAKTNRELTQDKAEQAEVNDIVNVLGAKNLLPNNVTTQIVNEVTFTINADGSVTLNGTASESGYLAVGITDVLPAGNYIASGCPATGSSSTYNFEAISLSASSISWVDRYEEYGAGVRATLDGSTTSRFMGVIRIRSGQVFSNLTFYPMIRLASITDNTYVPYAKSNKELTGDINVFNLSFTYPSTITSDSDLFKEVFVDCVTYLDKVGDCATGCATWMSHGYRGFQIVKVTSNGYKGTFFQENKTWTAIYDSSNDTVSVYRVRYMEDAISYNDLTNKPTIDDSINTTSTNPVQNKILANRTWTLHGITRIPENADLNDYVNDGNYFCGTSSTGGTVLHKPTEGNIAFALKVYETLSNGRHAIPSSSAIWVNKIQEFIAYTGERFYRKIQISDIPGQWEYDTWQKIYDSGANKVPYSEITGKPTVDSTPTIGSNNLISSGGVYSAIANEASRATQAENELRATITRTYKASGSIYFNDLPLLDESRQGNVYNIKDSFTTTSNFVEGVGKGYPAGTNVAIISVEGDYYNQVTPIGTENPSEEGWYVVDNTTYSPTSDTTVVNGTVYYLYSDHKMMYDICVGFIDTSDFVRNTDYATTQIAGIIKPDGTTCTVDANGALSVSGGHTIKDSSTTFVKRTGLKFLNCTVTDDSTNDETIISPSTPQITVDNTLSTSSTNPVQNDVITNALNNKQSKPTMKSASLAAGASTVTFTEIPTSGDYIVNFFSSDGSYYIDINTATAGQVTLTFEPVSYVRTIYCEIRSM